MSETKLYFISQTAVQDNESAGFIFEDENRQNLIGKDFSVNEEIIQASFMIKSKKVITSICFLAKA